MSFIDQVPELGKRNRWGKIDVDGKRRRKLGCTGRTAKSRGDRQCATLAAGFAVQFRPALIAVVDAHPGQLVAEGAGLKLHDSRSPEVKRLSGRT
jgi:hypothetical protein